MAETPNKSNGLFAPIRNVLVDWRALELARQLSHVLKEIAPTSVLDVGSSDGYVLHHVVQKLPTVARHVAIDTHPLVFDESVVQKYDGVTMPYKDQEFDVAICCFVLHHCTDPTQVLKEMRRVAKHVVVLEDMIENIVQYYSIIWQHDWMDANLDMPYIKEHFHTQKEWQSIFKAAPLHMDVVHYERFSGTFPFVLTNCSHVFHCMRETDGELHKYKTSRASYKGWNPIQLFNAAAYSYMVASIAGLTWLTIKMHKSTPMWMTGLANAGIFAALHLTPLVAMKYGKAACGPSDKKAV